jgi:hypothetical protein
LNLIKLKTVMKYQVSLSSVVGLKPNILIQ